MQIPGNFPVIFRSFKKHGSSKNKNTRSLNMTVINLEQAAELFNVSIDVMKNIIVNERPPEKHQMDYFLHETLFIKEELLEWKNERDRKKEERDKKEKEEGEKRLELRRCQIIINIESFLEDLKEKKIIEKYDDSLLWKLELYDLLPLEGSHLKNIK